MSGIDMEYNGQPNGHNSENGGDRYDEPLRNIEPREDYDKFEEDYPESSDPCEGFGKRAGNYDPVTGTYPRISRPVEVIRPSYDCVVIGSGYGGAVAASRMARGHKSVCLLERGKERWPGEFPTDSVPAIRELHMTNAATDGVIGRLGKAALGHDPTGLYHLYVGDGQNAFVANGLGGTSLLNANVFLEADSKTLDLPIWPKDIKGQGLKNCKSLPDHLPRSTNTDANQTTSELAPSSSPSSTPRTTPGSTSWTPSRSRPSSWAGATSSTACPRRPVSATATTAPASP